MPNPIRIIIAEVHKATLGGIKALFNKHKSVAVIGTATNKRELLSLLEKQKAEVILIDVEMPMSNGSHITDLIAKQYPLMKILATTADNSEPLIKLMMDTHSQGCILKDTDHDEFITAINTLYSGGEYFTPEVLKVMVKIFRKQKQRKDSLIQFTKREKEVAKLMLTGITNNEIAAHLAIGTNTVKFHRKNLFSKCEVKNLTTFIIKVNELGLLE